MVCDTVSAIGRLRYKGEFETVVVIDGSADGTAAALAHLSCPFPLRVINQENGGLAAARNRGSTEARGDILLFLDDDMTVDPDLLEEHAQLYRDGTDAVVGLFSEAASIGAALTPCELGHSEVVTTPFKMFGGHLSVRSEAFRVLNGFDVSFTEKGKYGYEDFEFGYRFLQRFTVHQSSRVLSHHRKVVSPREFIRRARTCADAEVHLVAKHPELLNALLEWKGSPRMSNRLRQIVIVPLLPQLLAELASYAAELAYRTPLRSSKALRYVCGAAYALAYWSTVKRNGGIFGLGADRDVS